MANERTEILYGPRAEIHTIKTGKIKHTLRYVGNNHYVTTPSSEKHDVQRTHYSLDDALDHLRKQGHQISKTDLHPSNKTPIVKESNMKDFKDFVKTTYAGLMEVEGLNEARKILPITDAIKNHPDTESKLGLSSRVSNDQRKTKTYTTHSMSFYTHHPKLNYVRIEHVHQPSSKYSTGEHHVVHITGFPKEDLPSRPDGAGTALYGGGEGGTAHEAYDKAIKAFDPNAR